MTHKLGQLSPVGCSQLGKARVYDGWRHPYTAGNLVEELGVSRVNKGGKNAVIG